MKTVEYKFEADNRAAEYRLYVLGDIHIGALNCAEPEIISLVHRIKDDPNARWVGGGDVLDAVILQDVKRFDINSLPNWMVSGSADSVKEKVGDIIAAQKKRFLKIVEPIKDKCLGLIEGNHEYSIYKHHNRDIMNEMCDALEVPNLTDCCFMRLHFTRKSGICSAVVTAFICHGSGGGCSAGAEPNRLARLSQDKHCDIILTGHSHTVHILPPVAMMYLPTSGKLVDEPMVREKYAANWGSTLYTYKAGPSTYASRANYPLRAMYTVATSIKPFVEEKHTVNGEKTYHNVPRISMQQIKL